MKLSKFEVDVILVFAFVRSGLLCPTDGHCRRPELNDKQIFVAKCLDCDVTMVCDALRDDHKLRRYGCLDEDLSFNPDLLGFLYAILQSVPDIQAVSA